MAENNDIRVSFGACFKTQLLPLSIVVLHASVILHTSEVCPHGAKFYTVVHSVMLYTECSFAQSV